MSARIISFDSEGEAIHGLLYPADESRGLVVICDPFAEEKKCAHRPLVDAARALSGAGYSVLRFDYRGTGNSGGRFVDVTPEHWMQDIHRAVDFGKQELNPPWIAPAGLRIGATMAARVACERDDIGGLILWEPVIDGARYVKQNLRRSQIKAMLTDEQQFDAGDVKERHAGDVVDFDGYEISAATMQQLEAMGLGESEGTFGGPVLVVNIGPRDEPGDAYAALAATFPEGQARGIRLEPFWNRIGLIDGSPMIEITAQWLSEVRQ